MIGGSAVTWLFGDVGAKLVVTPKRVERNRKVSFVWSASKVNTKVVLKLEPRGKTSTLVSVDDPAGLATRGEFRDAWARRAAGRTC